MTVTDLHSAVAIPAGWYPDPADPSGLRWWSGENWTEHTSAPQPAVALEPEPVVMEEPAQEAGTSDFSRFSRDPLVTGQPASVSAATMSVVRVKDPYRERNVLPGIALGIALLGLFAFIAGQIFELPAVILYFFGGVPFTIATLAVVVAIRTGRGLMVAVIAAVLCLVNVGMTAALAATTAREELDSALASTATFEELVEDSVISTTNTLDMPAQAVSADCPTMAAAPEIGTVFDCIVTLANGDGYLVHVTSKDGIGAMAMELVDQPLAPASPPTEG